MYALVTKMAEKIVEQDVSTKVDMDGPKVGCNDPDSRGIKTQDNLVKNKLRAMGLKMSYEPEGEQIDEVAPLVIGAGLAAAAAAPYLLKKFAKPAIDKAIDKPATGSGGLIDKMKQRRDATNQMNSYQPEGDVIDERRRSEKGTPRKPRDLAFELVAKSMGSNRLGVQPRGKKKSQVDQHTDLLLRQNKK
jgi:hypothetical protein